MMRNLSASFFALAVLAQVAVAHKSGHGGNGGASYRHKRTTASNCSSGYYFTNGSCQPCPVGQYNNAGGQTSCQLARAGYYVPSTGATGDTACPSGTYTGTTGQSSCASCPAGSFCGQNTSNPQKCSAGTYSGAGASACTSCAAGTFNQINGATSCCPCCAGWFTPQSHATNCQQCSNQQPYSAPGSSSCSSTNQGYTSSSSCSQNQNTGQCPGTFTTNGLQVSARSRRRDIPRPHCERAGEKVCPIYAVKHGALELQSYECLDTKSNLESCGGCSNFGQSGLDGEIYGNSGRDCSAIPNVDAVSCQQGKCVIESCRPGYIMSQNGATCILPPLHSLSPRDMFRLARNGAL